MARWIIMVGLLLLLAGIVLEFAPWLVGWFGKLPGDIRIESGRSRVFIPITSMVVISVVLSIIVNLFRR